MKNVLILLRMIPVFSLNLHKKVSKVCKKDLAKPMDLNKEDLTRPMNKKEIWITGIAIIVVAFIVHVIANFIENLP